MPGRKRRGIRKLTIVVIIAIIAGSLLLYYFSIGPPAPSSPYVKEFETKATSFPNAIAVDNQGRVWFASWNETAIGMLNPSNGTVKFYSLPEPNNAGLETWGIIVDNKKNVVWFAEPNSNAIWSFNIQNNSFAKYPIPTSGAFPYQVALDKKGNLWFSESFSGKIGELIPGGNITEYAIPGNGYTPDPTGLVIENGTLWFTEPNENMIGSFQGGVFTLYNMTGSVYSPVGIASDSHGNLWITEHVYPGLIAEFNPANGFVKTFATSYPPEFGSSLPYFIYTDANGNVWFNEHYGNSIAELNPVTDSLMEYHVPLKISLPGNLSGILTMALSQNGEPWFTELFTGNIGTINTIMPVEQSLMISNTSQLSVANGTSSTLSIAITGRGTSYLSAYIGNFTTSFKFFFSPESGSGNFSSTIRIQNNGAKPGKYFVTISDANEFITVSKIVEFEVP